MSSASASTAQGSPVVRWATLAGLLVLCVGGGSFIGLLFAGETQAYGSGGLELPAWAPPSWLFGPVWTVLYVLMAVGAWLVWRSPGARGARRPALFAFALQLAVNFAWTPVFFGLGAIGPALAVIVGVLGAATWWAVAAHRVRPLAGWLQVPYLAWVAFATCLNAAILLG